MVISLLVMSGAAGAILNASDAIKPLEMKSAAKSSRNNSAVQSKRGYIQIIYRDWSALDVVMLKKRYNIIPVYGIADGVLIFYYSGDKNIAEIIKRIKTDQKGIADVRVYKKNHFVTF